MKTLGVIVLSFFACMGLAAAFRWRTDCTWQRPGHGSGALAGVALEDRRLCAPANLESECFRRLGYQQVCR